MIEHEKQFSTLYEQIGRLKVENEFLKKSVMCSEVDRRRWIEPDHACLSVRAQCELLGLNRSGLYYTPVKKGLSTEQLGLLRFYD